MAHEWGVLEIRFSPVRVDFDPSLAAEDIFCDVEKTREFSKLLAEVKQKAKDYDIQIIDRTARSVRALHERSNVPA